MIDPIKFSIGLVLAVLIAFAARKVRALNRSGMWAAALLGTIIMGLGGFGWAVLLMGFFISSSLLSRLFKKQKGSLDEKYAKGSERDAGQVLANGGIAGLFAILHVFFPQAIFPWLGFAGALASANADTWATELGVLSPYLPRKITTLKSVERGTSGGVTLTGTLAALGGSAFIALLAVLFQPEGLTAGNTLAWFTAIALAGLGGSLVDSLLGASLQAIYRCPVCNKETERSPLHTCGTTTTLLRGVAWLNNDWVNTLCTFSGAILCLLLALQRATF